MQLLGVPEQCGNHDFLIVKDFDGKSRYINLGRVTASPFYDCQSFALGGFNEVFRDVHTVEQALSILLTINRYVGKSIMIFNINTDEDSDDGTNIDILYDIITVIKTRKIITYDIPTIESIDYTSANGSPMALIIFNMLGITSSISGFVKEFPNIKLLKYQRICNDKSVITYGEERSFIG